MRPGKMAHQKSGARIPMAPAAAVSFAYGSYATIWCRMKLSGRTRAEAVVTCLRRECGDAATDRPARSSC
jgi:hypothetical protein